MRHGTTTLKPRGWRFQFDRLIVYAFLSFISFRFVAIPFAIVWMFEPPLKRTTYRWITTVALLAMVFSPIDIDLPNQGWLNGEARSGVRLVRAACGCMPVGHEYRRRYGEWIHVGYPSIHTPSYLLVWRQHDAREKRFDDAE